MRCLAMATTADTFFLTVHRDHGMLDALVKIRYRGHGMLKTLKTKQGTVQNPIRNRLHDTRRDDASSDTVSHDTLFLMGRPACHGHDALLKIGFTTPVGILRITQ